ncbi:MAG: hypothetical protein Q9159_006860 [Coniocarpon cinnabarinum]
MSSHDDAEKRQTNAGLSAFASLLDPNNRGISKEPIKYDQPEATEPKEDKQTPSASLAFKPLKRPAIKHPVKPRPGAVISKPPTLYKQDSSSAPVPYSNSQPAEAPSATSQPTEGQNVPYKPTLQDWMDTMPEDEDAAAAYAASKQQARGGGRQARKRKREKEKAARAVEEAELTHWKGIYDPSKPNRYQLYKGSDEFYDMVDEWKAFLQSRTMALGKTRQAKRESTQRRSAFAPQTGMSFAPPTVYDEDDKKKLDDDDEEPYEPPSPSVTLQEGARADHVGAQDANGVDNAMQQSPPAPAPAPAPHVDEDMEDYEPPPPPPPAAIPGSISRVPVHYNIPQPPPATAPGSISREAVRYEDVPATSDDRPMEDEPPNEEIPQPSTKRPGQKDFAKRMLAKMGWQEGSGLGAQGTGIATPLSVQLDKRLKKSSSEGGGFVGPPGKGRIVGGKLSKEGKAAEKLAKEEAERLGELSEVLVLDNMLAGHDIETVLTELNFYQALGDECGEKFGRVERIFVQREGEERGRVFVKFTERLSAMRALQAFEGRDYGGNTIEARYFNPDKFEKEVMAGSPARYADEFAYSIQFASHLANTWPIMALQTLGLNDAITSNTLLTMYEAVAAREALDEEHDIIPEVAANDSNSYKLGRIGKHNVVIAVLPDGEDGTDTAAAVATNLLASFRNVRVGLMVGIGGGAPTSRHDVRLGDVVVSSSSGSSGGVLQYDFGKAIQEQELHLTRVLNLPPGALRTAVAGLWADYERDGHSIHDSIENICTKRPRLRRKYQRSEGETDFSFAVMLCIQQTHRISPNKLISRSQRQPDEDNPAVHYGPIASGNSLMKDALTRDRIATARNILCFEMEAAGLMNSFPCLVIRGICDYADTHKHKEWQGYASMAAALYARDLLYRVSQSQVQVEREIVNVISKDVKDIKHFQEDDLKARICEWLSGGESEREPFDVQSVIAPGTGQWFLQHQSYLHWKNGDLRNLICPGIAGAGKTVLSAMAIADWVGQHHDSAHVCHCVVYHFCKYQPHCVRAHENILTNFLAQLTRQVSPIPPPSRELYERFQRNGQRPSASQLLESIRRVVAIRAKLYVVIDALDEWPKDEQSGQMLIDVLLELRAQCNSVQFLLTSRPGSFLLSRLQAELEETTAVEIKAKSQDLQLYLGGRFVNIECLEGQEETTLKQEMVTKVVHAADGIDHLLDAVTTFELRDRLSKLRKGPNAITEAYQTTFNRIAAQSPSRRALATAVLVCMHQARRPLTGQEIGVAVSIQLDDVEINSEKFIRPKQMASMCAGLLTYRKEADQLVSSHQTVSEYLQSTRPEWVANQRGWLASTFVNFLRMLKLPRDLRTDHQSSSNFTNSLLDFCRMTPLAEYALYHCCAQVLSRPDDGELCVQFTKRLDDEALYSAIASIEHMRPGSRRLHFLAQFGYKAGIVRELGRKDSMNLSVDVLDDQKHTPLHRVCDFGELAAMQSLLSRGANPNAVGGLGTPLMMCSMWPRHFPPDRITHMMQVLFDGGADPNVRDKWDETALHKAASRSDPSIVKFLLERRADTEAGRLSGETPVICAAKSFNPHRLGTLCEHGANLAAKDERGLTAADHAVERNRVNRIMSKELVTKLLPQAVCWRSASAVETLLGNGGDPDSKDSEGIAALTLAVEGGEKSIVRLLSERSACPNVPDSNGKTPFVLAAMYARDDIARILREHGADPNIRDSRGITPLMRAVECCDTDAAEILVHNGADPNIQNNEGNTALIEAAKRGDEGFARLLCAYGANPNLQNLKGCTALMFAAASDRPRALIIVEILLKHGADSSIQDAKGVNVEKVMKTHLSELADKMYSYEELLEIHTSEVLMERHFFELMMERHLFEVKQLQNLSVEERTRLYEEVADQKRRP